jgi:hypothetical protein
LVGECIEERPVREILIGWPCVAGLLLSGGIWVDGVGNNGFDVGDAEERRLLMSRFWSRSIAFWSVGPSKLITPRVQCNTPTGRIAFGWMRVATLVVCSGWFGDT